MSVTYIKILLNNYNVRKAAPTFVNMQTINVFARHLPLRAHENTFQLSDFIEISKEKRDMTIDIAQHKIMSYGITNKIQLFDQNSFPIKYLLQYLPLDVMLHT
jgi:hypothetical protein